MPEALNIDLRVSADQKNRLDDRSDEWVADCVVIDHVING